MSGAGLVEAGNAEGIHSSWPVDSLRSLDTVVECFDYRLSTTNFIRFDVWHSAGRIGRHPRQR